MNILENLISAFSILRGSKLRTILTLLGITIGIAGVIAMMSFGAGAEKLLMAEIDQIGGPSMFGVYRPGHIRKNGRWQRNTSPHHLEMDDLRDVLAECPSVEVATVEGSYYISLGVEGKFQKTYLRATTNEYQSVREWRTQYGRFLADTDMDTWTKVCVIGSKIWKEQFKGQDPIGKEVIINNHGTNKRFTVIGIMESRGDGLERGRSDDNMLFIPITTAQKRFWGHDHVGHIMVRAKSPLVVDQALKEVKTIIMRNHGGDETFFRTWSAKKGIANAKRMIFIIETVLVVIASVSLIVAGIGILNIMLVSVTERIPEIGLRKAVGAKSFDIRLQFLTESVLLCLIGSLLGIMLGTVVGKGFAWIVGQFLKGMAWPSVITPEAVLVSVGAGAAIGIFFGYYPASQAAKLAPIDAIRHTLKGKSAILENLISAFSVLRGSKLRTILTLLGITIGIAGVIAMMSFGAGAEKLMMGEIESIGGPSMFGVYRPGYIEKNDRWQRNTSPHFLEMRDLHDILADCPSVEVATVERSHPIDFEVEGKHQRTYLRATTNEYQDVRRWQTEYGRFIADTDMDFWNKVCVIGSKVWKEQFKGQNPIGREVGIDNKRFTVIGVMESRGDGLEKGRSDDNMIFIPITTAQTRMGGRNQVGAIMARAKSIHLVDQALKEVKTVIMRNHGGDDTFFRTWNAKKGIEGGKRIIFIIEMVLVVIASVALIVAGIGILNIMLVSVTERIPEIGLRKAVGATSFDIRLQFLTESVLLCLIGSLLGIAFGAVVGKGFAWAVGHFFSELTWPSVVTLRAILISVAAGASIGIFFGYYPASQAAKLAPIDAIRHT